MMKNEINPATNFLNGDISQFLHRGNCLVSMKEGRMESIDLGFFRYVHIKNQLKLIIRQPLALLFHF